LSFGELGKFSGDFEGDFVLKFGRLARVRQISSIFELAPLAK